MELQQEDKVVSKSFSAFFGTVSETQALFFKCCDMYTVHAHTAANHDMKQTRKGLINVVCESVVLK